MKRYRYPGVNYFTRKDRNIFYGREKDTERLFRRLSIHQTLVLHAESGIGKSSLIRAGLIPYIDAYNSGVVEESDFYSQDQRKILPVTIRRITTDNEKESLIVDEIIQTTKSQTKRYIGKELQSLPIIENDNSLWYLVKQIQFLNYDVLFIFDQFEEIQTYTHDQIKYFEKHLSLLFQTSIPKVLERQIKAFILNDRGQAHKRIEDLEKLELRLNSKALFAIREDRLGAMSLLSNRFPDILKNNFYLKGLDINSAKQAIEKPASTKGGDFESNTFQFKDDAIKEIIKNLKNPETHLINPLEIQIVCKSLERRVIEGELDKIKKSDIESISNIIESFYNHVWDTLKASLLLDYQQIEKIKKSINSMLVVGEKRVPVPEGKFPQKHVSKITIRTLERQGFLRKLTTSNNTFYELSHDRLIEPLLDDLKRIIARQQAQKLLQKSIEQEEEKLKIAKIWFYAFIFVFAGVIMFYNYYEFQEKKSEFYHFKSIITLTEKDNPSFAFYLTNFFQDKYGSKKWPAQLTKDINSSEAILLSKIIPLNDRFVNAELKNDTVITITEAYHKTKWNLLSHQVISRDSSKIPWFKAQSSEMSQIFIKRISDSILAINNASDSTLYQLKGHFENATPSRLVLSNNKNFLLSDNQLYNIKENKLIGRIPEIRNIAQNGRISFKFLNDNRHFAIGYWTGYVVIYHIDESDTDNPIKYSKFYYPQNGTNSVANAISIDSRDSILVVGDRQNDIFIWPIRDLKSIAPSNRNLLQQLYNTDIEQEPMISIRNYDFDYINSLTISPNDSTLLSISEDAKAYVLDIYSGKIMSQLSGIPSNRITGAGFLDDNCYYMIHDNDKLSYWVSAKKNIQENIKDKKRQEINDIEHFKFSPYSFNSIGLERKYWEHSFRQKNSENQYSNLLNYLMSLPLTNNYRGNEKYLKLLENSIKEIQDNYDQLLGNKDYVSDINNPSRYLLRLKFDEFNHIIRPRLLLINENKDSLFNNYLRLSRANANILTDTLDVHLMNETIALLGNMTFKLSDTTVNSNKFKKFRNTIEWDKVLLSLEELDALFEIWDSKKILDKVYSNNKVELSKFAQNSSYHILFDNFNYPKALNEIQQILKLAPLSIQISYEKFSPLTYPLLWQHFYLKKAIYLSSLALKWEPKELQIANKTLALAYVLSDQWEKAEVIYKQWNNKYFKEGDEETADVLFLRDIEDFEKKGVQHVDFAKARAILED